METLYWSAGGVTPNLSGLAGRSERAPAPMQGGDDGHHSQRIAAVGPGAGGVFHRRRKWWMAQELIHPCMGPSLSRSISSVHSSFFVRLKGPFLRPDLRLRRAACGAGVKDGRRPPPEAARSVLDAGEHGARLVMPRRTVGIAIRPEGSSPCAPRCFAWQPCIRPIPRDRYHDADIRIGGEAPSGGPILQERHQGRGWMRDTATSDRHRQRLLREQTSTEPSILCLYSSYAVVDAIVSGARRVRRPDAAACRPAPCRW
jgi:hypothetical protein